MEGEYMKPDWYESDRWIDLYEGRYVFRSKLSDQLNEKRYCPNLTSTSSHYINSGISLYTDLYIERDEDSGYYRLAEINYQKLRDRSGSHFLPHPDNISLTYKDIDNICAYLDEVTISRGEKVLDVLLKRAEEVKPSLSGYSYHHQTSDYVIFIEQEMQKAKLSKILAVNMIELAFINSDLLTDEQAYESYRNVIDKKRASLLLCLFSCIEINDDNALQKMMPTEGIFRLLDKDEEIIQQREKEKKSKSVFVNEKKEIFIKEETKQIHYEIIKDYSNGSDLYSYHELMKSVDMINAVIAKSIAQKILARFKKYIESEWLLYSKFMVKVATLLDDTDMSIVFLSEILKSDQKEKYCSHEHSTVYVTIWLEACRSAIDQLKKIDAIEAKKSILSAINSVSLRDDAIEALKGNCKGVESELFELIDAGYHEAVIPLLFSNNEDAVDRISALLQEAIDGRNITQKIADITNIIARLDVKQYRELAAKIVDISIEERKKRVKIENEKRIKLSDNQIKQIVLERYNHIIKEHQQNSRSITVDKPFYVVYELHCSLPGSESYHPILDYYATKNDFLIQLSNYLKQLEANTDDSDEYLETMEEIIEEIEQNKASDSKELTLSSFDVFNTIFQIEIASYKQKEVAEYLLPELESLYSEYNSLNEYEEDELREFLDRYPLMTLCLMTAKYKQTVDPKVFLQVYDQNRLLDDSAPTIEDDN